MSASTSRLPLAFAFDDELPAGSERVALLGGKGANLAEMTQALGLRVPPGFTITTAVCRAFLDGGWPPELDDVLAGQLERLGARLGQRLGAPETPLLVSVRSGAPASMPGMMDTLLNVGMTAAVRDALAERAGAAFAHDTWLRFLRMYAEIVLRVPADDVAAVAQHDGTVAAMKAAADRVLEQSAIPGEPFEQVRGAVAAVFESWRSERASMFRKRERIDESMGTAVTIQAMVFGNLGARSGTGVAFTRDPATGDAGPYGDYLAGAQGEDVVAGDHAVSGLESLATSQPEAYRELVDVLARLERHYGDMCDVEFTLSEGTLYILQTRIGRRSPLAAVRIAIAMADDPTFPLSRAEAIARVDAATLQQLSAMGTVGESAEAVARGLPASPGIGTGVLCCDPDRAAEMTSHGIAVVLAREETSPSDIHGMIGASAIVTRLGGVASHAAVVARSWAIPAVTGLAEMSVRATGIEVAGTFIAEGELVTVDGTGGSLFAGDQRAADAVAPPEVATIRAWAAALGLEPGTAAMQSDSAGRSADVTLYELARTVQLKGLCTPERAAAVLAAAETRIAALLESNEGLFQSTPRGYMLSGDGRTWATEQLIAERDAANLGALENAYQDFLALNHRFKQLVSEWQVETQGNDPQASWARVVQAVETVDDGLKPVLAANAQEVPRLASYSRRFAAARAALQEGDRSMLASPLKDSYHTVWFEYHEELIALCGRDRAHEEA